MIKILVCESLDCSFFVVGKFVLFIFEILVWWISFNSVLGVNCWKFGCGCNLNYFFCWFGVSMIYSLFKLEGWVMVCGLIVLIMFEVGVWIGNMKVDVYCVSGWFFKMWLFIFISRLLVLLMCCLSGSISLFGMFVLIIGWWLDWCLFLNGWMLLGKF